MITGIDHVVVLVDELPMAMAQYEALGFVVTRGGVHPGAGTENALIALADGSYLELLAIADPVLATHHPLWQRPEGGRRKAGEFGGFALSTDDVDRDAARIADQSLALSPPREGSRARPDGTMIRWRVSFPQRSEIPFLIEDVTPRELRIAPPTRGLGLRARIAEVRVATEDLSAAARAYNTLLDTPAMGAAPAGDEVHFLTTRGEITLHGRVTGAPGIHEIILAVADWSIATRELLPVLGRRPGGWLIPPNRAAGARILLQPRAAR